MPKQKPLNIPASSSRLKHLANELRLSESAQQRAMVIAGLKPDNQAWLRLIDKLLLVCGATLLVAGVASFFAYNWQELHKFAKFALIQSGLVVLVLLTIIYDFRTPLARASLLAAAVLTGILLAVYGQTYQTGADPYGLFLTWAVLITGWVLVSRHAGMWLLLLILCNLTLILYWTQVVHPEDWTRNLVSSFGPFAGITYSLFDFSLAQWVFAINVLALVIWELMSRKNAEWMSSRVFPRVIVFFALTPIVVSTLFYIFSSGPGHYWGLRHLSPVLFVFFVVPALFYYSKKYLDMFILASCLFAVMLVITSLVAKVMNAGFELFFLLCVLVIVQSTAAASWLRKVKSSWSATE